MKSTWWMPIAVALLSLLSLPGFSQTPAAVTVLGQVESVDPPTRTVRMKTEDGASLTVTLAEKGTVVKVAPGEKSLQNAAPIAFDGIAAGDRVLVRGGTRSEARIEGALRVVVMAQTDLAARNESEQRAWRERGVAGTLVSADAAKGEFTLQLGAATPAGAGPAPTAPKTLVVDAKKSVLHRYADTSVKFDDATPGTVAEMAEGDQVRVLGTRSPDGASMTAERVVFGHFKTVTLAIEHIDPATGLLSVKDLQSNKKFTLSVVPSGPIRRIPPEMAAMFTALSGAPGGRPGGQRPEGGAPPTTMAGNPGAPRPEAGHGQPGGGSMAGGMGGGDHGGGGGMGGGSGMGGRGPAGGGARSGRVMEDMLEKMPLITIAGLKKGDWIGAVVSRIDASGKGVAFNVIAGIEVFAARANRSGGVDVGMPAGLLDGGMGVP
jgi:hypothetical protein